jgi:hypothetical protein
MLTVLSRWNKHLAALASSAALALSASGHTADLPSPGAELASRILRLSDSQRVHALAELPRAELLVFYQHMTQADLLALGRKALAGFGVYRARASKDERVDGHTRGPDVIDTIVREEPRAVLLDFVGGPHKGRRVLYNAELRPRQMLARESGMLGFISVWLSIDSWLARRDTHHRITEVGFGAMLDIMAKDLARVRPAGGYQRQDEGFDAHGRYCIFLSAPPTSQGLSAERLRFCVDAGVGVPLRIEVYDALGLREYLDYRDLQLHLDPDSLFEPAHAGL